MYLIEYFILESCIVMHVYEVCVCAYVCIKLKLTVFSVNHILKIYFIKSIKNEHVTKAVNKGNN